MATATVASVTEALKKRIADAEAGHDGSYAGRLKIDSLKEALAVVTAPPDLTLADIGAGEEFNTDLYGQRKLMVVSRGAITNGINYSWCVALDTGVVLYLPTTSVVRKVPVTKI